MPDFKGKTLGFKQRAMPIMSSRLINFAYDHGFHLKFGDAYRDPRATFPYAPKPRCHQLRLAVDLLLCSTRGHYYGDTEDYEFLGVEWELMGGTWGGRWGDGNHFSIEHNGMR